MQISAFYPKE